MIVSFLCGKHQNPNCSLSPTSCCSGDIPPFSFRSFPDKSLKKLLILFPGPGGSGKQLRILSAALSIPGARLFFEALKTGGPSSPEKTSSSSGSALLPERHPLSAKASPDTFQRFPFTCVLRFSRDRAIVSLSAPYSPSPPEFFW